MTTHMLSELSHLFSLEAFEADRRGDHDEADRLWDVSHDIHERLLAKVASMPVQVREAT